VRLKMQPELIVLKSTSTCHRLLIDGMEVKKSLFNIDCISRVSQGSLRNPLTKENQASNPY